MSKWQPIDTAPRDGTVITIGDDEENYRMFWDPEGRNEIFAPGVVGLWVSEGKNFTWRESAGGPTHWRPASFSQERG